KLSSKLRSKSKCLYPLNNIYTQPINKRINFLIGTQLCHCNEHVVLKFSIYSSKVETTDVAVIIEGIIDIIHIFGELNSKFVERLAIEYFESFVFQLIFHIVSILNVVLRHFNSTFFTESTHCLR